MFSSGVASSKSEKISSNMRIGINRNHISSSSKHSCRCDERMVALLQVGGPTKHSALQKGKILGLVQCLMWPYAHRSHSHMILWPQPGYLDGIDETEVQTKPTKSTREIKNTCSKLSPGWSWVMLPPFPPVHLPLPLHHYLFLPWFPPLHPPLLPPLAGRCNQGFQQRSNQLVCMQKFLKIMFVRSSGASLICGETASCLKENCNTLKWIVILNI